MSVDAALLVTTWTWSRVPNGFGLPFTLGSCRANFLPSRSLHMSNVSSQTSVPSGHARMTASASDDGGNDGTPPATSSPRAEGSGEGLGPSLDWFGGAAPTNSVVHPNGKTGALDVPARAIGRVHSCFGLCTASQGSSESILSCGYWDNVVRVHRVNSAVKLHPEGSETGGHRNAITCLAMAEASSLLVTGGQDATCRVWVVGNTSMAAALGGTSSCGVNATKGPSSRESMVCVHVLYGHEAPVTCLALSAVST